MSTGKEEFFNLVREGREGKNIGLSVGSKKLENFIDGYLPGTSYLIGAISGVGCVIKGRIYPFKKTAVPIEESLELLQTNIGGDWNVNTEISTETKESVPSYSVETEPTCVE